MVFDIKFLNPFKECVAIVGTRQEGKSNLLKYLLWLLTLPYTCFDTMGVVGKNFEPRDPETQRIIKPRFAKKEPAFSQACKDVWNQGNLIFAIEEVGCYCSKHVLPAELDSLINQGGNRNIALWVTTRRVAEVHNDIIANCQHHFIFRTYLPQDVEWYSKVVPKDIIAQSKELPKYHFIYYQLGGEPRIIKPVKDMTKA